MKKVEVCVLDEMGNAGSTMMFLARLTQRGHSVKNMQDLKLLFINAIDNKPTSKTVSKINSLKNHGTIKRFTPITIAVVGASRRFLSQIRTHSVGLSFVSASLQYSDYSGEADFYVPYEYIDAGPEEVKVYLDKCNGDLKFYEQQVAKGCSNDTAGYSMPQGLRNILIIQGNIESFQNLIRLRSCTRNTDETAYVAMKIWEALLTTSSGKDFFDIVGPDCMYGRCKEGKMSCGYPFDSATDCSDIMFIRWPKVAGDK